MNSRNGERRLASRLPLDHVVLGRAAAILVIEIEDDITRAQAAAAEALEQRNLQLGALARAHAVVLCGARARA